MKKTTFKSIKRIFCICLTLILSVVGTIPAFAAEPSSNVNQVANSESSADSVAEFAKENGFEILSSESAISREEALSSLGMTSEEAQNGTIYVKEEIVSPEASTRASITIPHNSSHTFAAFSFSSGKHTGGNIMAFNTGLAHFGCTWYWLNPNPRTQALLEISLCDSLGTPIHTELDGSNWGSGAKNTFTTDVFQVSRSKAYYFKYETRFGYYEPGFEWPSVKVIMTIYGD